MLFIRVVFNRVEPPQVPLLNEKWAHSFFMVKKGVILKIALLKVIGLKYIGLSTLNHNFLLKEIFFTSPQLKITLFNAVFLQFVLMPFVGTILRKSNSQLIKREDNVSVH